MESQCFQSLGVDQSAWEDIGEDWSERQVEILQYGEFKEQKKKIFQERHPFCGFLLRVVGRELSIYLGMMEM